MFKSIITSRLLPVGVAGVIAVGILGGASIAMADEPGGNGGEHRDGKLRPGIVIGTVLKNSGVTREELRQGADEDKSFGEIITAFGDKTVEQAKSDALAALGTRLTGAVTSGKLTQEKADQIEQAAPAAFDKLMAAKPGDHKAGPGRRGGKMAAIGKAAIETVAETLGMEKKDLVAELRGGATIADIAGDQTGEVVAALTAQANAAIDKAVADGKISAEKGAEAKSNVGERINNFVNNDHPGKGARGRQGPKAN